MKGLDLMSNNPHRCVIDADNNYVEFVLLIDNEDGSKTPYCYEMKPGETLIEATPPSGLIDPKWDSENSQWLGEIDTNPHFEML